MCREHPVHILAQEFQVQNSSNKATPQNIQATTFGVATHSLTNTAVRDTKNFNTENFLFELSENLNIFYNNNNNNNNNLFAYFSSKIDNTQ